MCVRESSCAHAAELAAFTSNLRINQNYAYDLRRRQNDGCAARGAFNIVDDDDDDVDADVMNCENMCKYLQTHRLQPKHTPKTCVFLRTQSTNARISLIISTATTTTTVAEAKGQYESHIKCIKQTYNSA